MAVRNEYVNSDIAAGKPAKAIHSTGAPLFYMEAKLEIAAADDDASVLRLFKNLNPNLVPVKIEIYCDAITGGTDYDLGLYETSRGGVDGAVISKDVFLDGGDLSSAVDLSDAPLSGLGSVDIDDADKTLYEHAGHTVSNKLDGYDLCLTANTIGSGAGGILVKAWFAQG